MANHAQRPLWIETEEASAVREDAARREASRAKRPLATPADKPVRTVGVQMSRSARGHWRGHLSIWVPQPWQLRTMALADADYLHNPDLCELTLLQSAVCGLLLDDEALTWLR
jgi:hypothetical protein